MTWHPLAGCDCAGAIATAAKVQTWPDGASYTGQWVKDLGKAEAVKRNKKAGKHM